MDFDGVIGHSAAMDKVDLAMVRIGDVIDIPYEVTAGEFWREMWQSVFYQSDRLFTSAAYCAKLRSAGDLTLRGHGGAAATESPSSWIPLPFAMMLYAATSMPHVDDTRNVLDLSFRNSVYERAVFCGDTLRRHFVIEGIRESSNGQHILIDVKCKMFNQRNELVFRVEKTMFFQKLSGLPAASKKPLAGRPGIDRRSAESSDLRRFLLNLKGQSLDSGHSSSKRLSGGELLLHTLQRAVGTESNMNLSMLHRMTHPLLYNTARSHPSELLVGGPLLIAMTHAVASKELYEVSYEELLDSRVVNKAAPSECVSAMTFVIGVDAESNEHFEEVECVTVGLKNVDITNQLKGVRIPLSLFQPGLFPKDIERICDKLIPQLTNKVVVHSHRKLLRAKPKDHVLIPLL